MALPFPTVWAVNGPVRDPTSPELDQGFPCGEADRLLFNGLFQDLQQAVNALALSTGNADIAVQGWQSAPPTSPASGDRYIVKPAATGAWAGHNNAIAVWVETAWLFLNPPSGLIANYWASARLWALRFDGTNWAEWQASKTERGPIFLTPDPLQESDASNGVTPADLFIFDRSKRATDVFFGNGQLLDNADFSLALRNLAATDQGNGGVPALTFTSAANTYHMDRWRSGAAGVSVNTATADRVIVSAGSLKQTMNLTLRSGTAVTVSARVLAGTLNVAMMGQTKTIPAGARASVTFTAAADVSFPVVEISGGGSPVTIERTIKAEFGEVATPYRGRHAAIERQILALYCQREDLRFRNSFDASGWASVVLPRKPIMGGTPTNSLVVRSSTGPLSGSTAVQLSAASCLSLGVASTGAGEVLADFTVVSDADFY